MVNSKSLMFLLLVYGVFQAIGVTNAFAAPLDQLPIDRWAKLR
jgi:hypothetical protein